MQGQYLATMLPGASSEISVYRSILASVRRRAGLDHDDYVVGSFGDS